MSVRGALIFGLIRRSERFSTFLADYTPLSPGLAGLESDRLPLLGAQSVSALVLDDFVLLRGFGSEGIPLWCADSGLVVGVLRRRIGDSWGGSVLCGVVLCVTWGAGCAGAGSEGTIAVPPWEFPMRGYEA